MKRSYEFKSVSESEPLTDRADLYNILSTTRRAVKSIRVICRSVNCAGALLYAAHPGNRCTEAEKSQTFLVFSPNPFHTTQIEMHIKHNLAVSTASEYFVFIICL